MLLVLLQASQDELPKSFRGIDVVGDVNFVLKDDMQVELRPDLERNSSNYQLIGKKAKRPDIDFLVMRLLSDDFRRVVKGSSTLRFAEKALRTLGSPTKITNLDDALRKFRSYELQQQIFRFDIAMDEPFPVDCLQPAGRLSGVLADFLLFKSVVLANFAVEVASGGKLAYDIKVIFVCEVSVEIDDVLTPETIVNSYLFGYLIFDLLFPDHGFAYYFKRADKIRL